MMQATSNQRGARRLRAQGPARGAEAGFTLIEAMLAVGILSFGLLTLAMMQLEAISQGAAGRHSQDAAAIARTHLEQIQRVPFSEITDAQAVGTWTATDWSGVDGTVNISVTGVGGGSASVKTYTVEWRVTDVLDGVGNPRPCLRDIELRVSWPEENMSSDKTLTLLTRRYNWGAATC
jgi:type IV pilus assembly protein PilV